MLNGRQRARLAVTWILSSCACQGALDLNRFDFPSGDAGPGAVQTGNMLAPGPSANGDQAVPSQPPGADPDPVPAAQSGNEPETSEGVGPPPPAEPPPAQPPPVSAPPSRPVLVSNVLFDTGFAGAQGGSERRGLCNGGTVMVGVSFYYYAGNAGGLGFLTPVCGRFGDDPAAPLDWTRDNAAGVWSQSDGLSGEPPPPFVDQLVGELVCPPRLVVAGARGTMDPADPTYFVRDLTLECAAVNEVPASSQVVVDRGGAALVASSVLLVSGIEQYSLGCDNGNVATGLFESTGSWLDGFALSCSSLRRPRIAGDACSTGDACLSGVCDGSGSCTAVEQ